MTFAPDFAFYRDDRPLDAEPAEEFWQAIKVEVRDMLIQRQETYPSMVAKGRMKRADADRELHLARAIAESCNRDMRTPGFPHATIEDMIHALRREISLRRQRFPQLVTAKRLDAAEAEHRLLTLEIWHDQIWHLYRWRLARQAARETRAAA